ncbi:JmjC domain-containing protein [Actinoplanes sp. NPDC049265]|uniref:JmjC domain-containing protein n=1 Tax=Actinoplanes sp. NPDC049265 TaxID=3363902 RepID=UPI00371EE59A
MLFDDTTRHDMLIEWPTKPTVVELPANSHLPQIVNAQMLTRYLDTGTAPAEEINVIKDGAARHPRAFTTGGHLDPAKVAMWRDRGYSFQLRNLNRWYPPLHAMCAAIQSETGYGCYVTGFVTPGGAQGLDYHWDQNMGIIYQMAGRKTWQIWKPVVEEPHRDHHASNTHPLADLVDRLKAAGPDMEFDLGPGQVLVLPRGWVHNPHAHGQQEQSVHLTFVVRERTGYWIGEKLASAAIESTDLRRAIAPARFADPAALAAEIDRARDLLIDWLSTVDNSKLADELLAVAKTELDVDYA